MTDTPWQGALIFNEKWLRGEATVQPQSYQLLSLLFKLLLLAWRDAHPLVGRQDFRIMLKELGVRFYNDGRIAFCDQTSSAGSGSSGNSSRCSGIHLPAKPFFPGKKPDGDQDEKTVGKSTSALWSCLCQEGPRRHQAVFARGAPGVTLSSASVITRDSAGTEERGGVLIPVGGDRRNHSTGPNDRSPSFAQVR